MTIKESELWMKIRYPVTIISDRYNGCYSDAAWLAFPLEREEVPEDVCGEDMEEMTFWDYYTGLVGKGATPDAAYKDLVEKVAEISNSRP